jgi:hypothetical protein
MKPDARDFPVDGLAHHVDRHVGVRGDDDAIEFSGHAREIRKTRAAFDLCGLGIDGKDLVAGVAQLPKNRIGRAPGTTGYTGDSDPPAPEEVSDELRNLRHPGLPSLPNVSDHPRAPALPKNEDEAL